MIQSDTPSSTTAAPPAAPATPAAEPTAVYEERCASFAVARDRLEARLRQLGTARLLTFLAAALFVVWGLIAGTPGLVAAGAVTLLVFIVLVLYHERVNRAYQREATLWQINHEAGRRLARDWDALPLRHTPAAGADHPYAADLDLFGRASLAHLLGTVATPPGESTLAAWLTAPAAPAVVRERQAAVVELASQLDLRQELELQGRLTGERRPDPEPFLAWAEDEPWLLRRPALIWLSRLLPLVTIALLVAELVGLLSTTLWPLFALANLGLSYTLGRPVDRILDRVAASAAGIEHYGELFALLARVQPQSPLLQRLQADLGSGELGASRGSRGLVRAVRLTYLRGSQFYLPVLALTLYNFHVLLLLERWQQRVGRRARAWLATLGEADALSALAALAHDNPDWAFPTLDDGTPRFEARALAHPLLPRGVRVANDVALGPPGTFLLVSGSNMSGKSTLLRSIGVNTVLAQAGGPVCAAALRLTPVTLHTSIRVQDSLERGVSYFMAELRRLKEVVDTAERTRAAGERTLLYLLDEILQGTNTVERQIAARRIILHLVAQGAIGSVTTHDLTLADDPELAAEAQPVHFIEHFARNADGPAMWFDYHLRPGLATSTNALKLMELIGLAVDAKAERHPSPTA